MSSARAFPAATPLPQPKRSDRWQPLRSGVLNLYRYDYEEFHYEDGRLLLRGNNGSGKSRVLALQLPFLLDGEVSPARVEPDGDSAKRIEWNLLMGSYPERTGYTWIEFGRRDADGTCHFLTLGCGLRAVAGNSGLHSRWFFVTAQRVGRDLFLQTAQRIPLGKERLAEAIGTAGKLWLKAEDYRRAVDEALFGLGPRYAALLELLLRLRRPQLSRKLDEEELSSALSDALPTLPSAIVDEVAESFQSLQADRDRLREFTAAHAAVAAFLAEYRTYMRIAVRRRADAFRESHSAYEAAQRDAKDAQTRFDRASGELSQLADLEAEMITRLAGAEAAERTLRESPEMRTAQEVELARTMAGQTEIASSRAKTDEEASVRAWDQAKDRQREMETQAADLARELGVKRKSADDGAHAAELGPVHRQFLKPELGADHLPEPIAAENAIRRALNQRERELVILRERDQAVAAADRRCEAAAEELRRAEDAASAAREAEHSAGEAMEAGARQLVESYGAWRGRLALLQPEPSDAVAETLSRWIQQRAGPSPVRLAVESAHDAAVTALAHSEAALKQTEAEITAQIADFSAAIDRLERGETIPPPSPPTRRDDRLGRLGAPLWRLCDFRPEVSLADRANFEAALQAAGLLDAWVMPDGRLLPEVEDEFLLAVAEEGESLPHHLGEILGSSIDADDPAASQVRVEGLNRLLARIGLGEGSGSHWIAADGRWQLGPLTGRATKTSADYIGESTRAAARRRQLAGLQTQRQAAIERREQIAQEQARVAEARSTAGAERAAAPSDESVVRAGIALEEAARRLAQAWTESERATAVSHARQADREEHLTERRRDAADLKLTGWIGRTEALAQATAHYEKALAGLWPTERHWTSTGRQLSALRQQALEAEAEHAVRRRRKDEASAAAEAARQRFETLQETHGQEISLILQKLAAATTAVTSIKGELEGNRRVQFKQTDARAKADSDRNAAEQRRAAHEERRQLAIRGMQRLVEQRLLAEAEPALRDADPEEWTVTQTVELVRHRIDPALTDTPDDPATWQKYQDAIHGHIQLLRDQLITHGHPPEIHQSDEITLVRCLFQGRPHTMTELGDAFAAELEQRERLLQAKEREIIENHLLAEAAVELQKLIRAAESWRASANEELTARPTSSGVRFRFQWEPDAEIKFHEVRPALLRKGELWTPGERAAVAGFLQGRIKAEQDADESASWKDQLAKALDYRRWHRFVVERQQNGQWRRLTRTTYGTGSGGEKALALTLPRFAAAAAHYRSAAKTAPRLVMLDEAFAGIDPTMRAQCMGVLTQFDLDVVMTSELEWGCYPTVPSLAIYHLTTLPGVDAVAATRWIWNGRERKQRDAVNAPDAPTEAGTEPELALGDDSNA